MLTGRDYNQRYVTISEFFYALSEKAIPRIDKYACIITPNTLDPFLSDVLLSFAS